MIRIDQVSELVSRALTDPSAARQWIAPGDVVFSEDFKQQAELNRRRYLLEALPMMEDQILTDYWMHHFDAATSVDDAQLSRAIKGVIELSAKFDSSYPLSMLEGHLCPLVRKSDQRAELIRMLRAARARAPEILHGAWDSFITDCSAV